MITWIVEHILLVFPSWFWIVFSGVGAIIYFFSDSISLIPAVVPYSKFAKAIGGIMLLVGVYLDGGAGVTATWKQEVKEMQAKVARAEQESSTANTEVQTVFKEKTKVIHDVQVVIQEKIGKDSGKMDANCVLDPVVIEDLNLAAKGKKK